MRNQPHNKYQFIKLIRFWGSIFLASIATVIIAIDLSISYHDLKTNIEQMRTSHLELQKDATKREVKRIVNLINHERAQSETLTRSKIKKRTYEALTIADYIYQKNKAKKSNTEIQQMIIDAIRPIRFENGNGYYFIYRMDGIAVLFSDKPEIEGLNLLDMQDFQGKYYIRDAIDIAEKSSEGFYEYHLTESHPTGRNFKTLFFIKRFKPYNWLIGTGLSTNSIEEQIKERWMDRINSIRFGNNQTGYLFAANWHGKSLAHGVQPDLIGQNGWEWEDSRGNKTSQMLIAASKKQDGGFTTFWWRKPDTGNESAKIAYAKSIPEWELFIASGVYIEDIEQSVLSLQEGVYSQTKIKIIIFITVVTMAFVIFLILFNFLSAHLRNDFKHFISYIDQMAYSNIKIDQGVIQFSELDKMAASANKMITDRKKAEDEIHSAKLFIDRVVEMSPYAMWISDDKGVVIRTNNSLRKILNTPDEKIVGKYNILNDRNIEDHGALPMVKAVFENHEPVNFTIPWKASKNGEVEFEDTPDLFVDVSIFPIVSSDGNLTNAVCQWVDITEHKKNEESLRERTRELDLSRDETIQRLALAAEYRDNETAEHNQRMSYYCKLLAERYGMNSEQCEKIRLASVMHDVGKIGISDLILLKPGRLTDEEFSLIKTHTEIGYRILSGSSSPLLEIGATIALTHHEKYDGSGYPCQLVGEEIPIEGRIAAVADVFDALTTNRVYRDSWSVDHTLELIVQEKGSHFDPLFVDILLESMDEVLKIKKRYADSSVKSIRRVTAIPWISG